MPPYLKAGDTIGVMCPAGAVESAKMEAMYQQLRQWGYQIEVGATVGNSYFRFAASDAERLAELQSMLDNPKIKAILFGRGGYGSVRLIDKLDFTDFVKNPKWLVGYSDITCFHSHLFSQIKVQSIHAHMGSAYQSDGRDEYSIQTINSALSGTPLDYSIHAHKLNREGVAEGKLVGGNLALLSDLIGTASGIETKDNILFIEDVGEFPYNIDRMMWQLKRSGMLESLSGLLVGGFTDLQQNETAFGMTAYEIVMEKVKDYKYPICFDFPVGHQARNWALKVGAPCRLEVGAEVRLKEMVLA